MSNPWQVLLRRAPRVISEPASQDRYSIPL